VSVACFFSIRVSTCDRNVHRASRIVSRDFPGGELVGFEPVSKSTRGRFCHEKVEPLRSSRPCPSYSNDTGCPRSMRGIV
ncbi:unnamed protein product, partial [Ectocarpus sp. 12 AP-2014]